MHRKHYVCMSGVKSVDMTQMYQTRVKYVYS